MNLTAKEKVSYGIGAVGKTSEEFNSDTVIENVWSLCGEEPAVDELPYWEKVERKA